MKTAPGIDDRDRTHVDDRTHHVVCHTTSPGLPSRERRFPTLPQRLIPEFDSSWILKEAEMHMDVAAMTPTALNKPPRAANRLCLPNDLSYAIFLEKSLRLLLPLLGEPYRFCAPAPVDQTFLRKLVRGLEGIALPAPVPIRS
ncbi:MAG: hypothetical protein HPY71_00100 [Firmicutes bacterium]|nr:hypothetical protein [Bacillota bacterium]